MNFEDYKKARLGGKYVKRIKLKETGLEIGLRLLSTQELLQSESAKNEYLKANKLEENDSASLLENNCQVIFRSAVNPDNSSEPFFQSVSDVRELTGEDLNWIASEYIILADTINPLSQDLTQQDVSDIKKNLENGQPPIGLSYKQLVQVLMVLVPTTLTVTEPVESVSEQT
jgi:hypothetical protein